MFESHEAARRMIAVDGIRDLLSRANRRRFDSDQSNSDNVCKVAHLRSMEHAMCNLSHVTLERRPLTMSETTTVREACNRMGDCRARSVLVTNEKGHLVGIFTSRDAVCRVLAQRRDPGTTKLVEVMTCHPTTMSPDQTAADALRLMKTGRFRHVPLLRNGRIVGVVSCDDFTRPEQNPTDEERTWWDHLR
jgi:CBS domain-containing protein